MCRVMCNLLHISLKRLKKTGFLTIRFNKQTTISIARSAAGGQYTQQNSYNGRLSGLSFIPAYIHSYQCCLKKRKLDSTECQSHSLIKNIKINQDPKKQTNWTW